jgi:predicted phosphodiesterase
MKIKVASDLHLEFADIDIQNDNNYDVLILSGDILVATKLTRPESKSGQVFRNFLGRCSERFPHVVYVAGNHEFYNNGRWYESLAVLETACSQYGNIYFLERSTKTIDDVIFVGGTLWTDMNKYDPLTLFHIPHAMNDYRAIRNDRSEFAPIKPQDTCDRHIQTRDYIFLIADMNPNKKIVVCTHHSPSFASCHPQYAHDTVMNGAYHSELSEQILDRPQIKLWTHGHTHHPFDYMIGSTRVVCNPRGYDGYEETGWNPSILLEV